MTTPLVLIDARMIRASGIGTYLRGLLSAMASAPPKDMRIALLGDMSSLPEGPWAKYPMTIPFYSPREQWEIPLVFRRTKAALFHAPHYNVPVGIARQSIVTVHDAIHYKFPEALRSPLERWYARFYFRRVLRRCRLLLTVSEHSRQDLAQITGVSLAHILVTSPAVMSEVSSLASKDDAGVLSAHRLKRGYFLYIGNLKVLKNTPRLLALYTKLRAQWANAPELVLAGKNFISGFDQQIAKTPGVKWLGELAPRELGPVYRAAGGFVFPSLYEGFGLPPLEAMSAGVPVLVSNRASLPEVVGDAALIADPDDETAFCRAMHRLIDDRPTVDSLREKGFERVKQFSWDAMLNTTLQAYRDALPK